MYRQTRILLLPLLVGIVVVVAIVVGIGSVLLIDPRGEEGSGLPDSFQYDIEQYKKIDPALIAYRQTALVPVEMQELHAVAAGPEDRIYVAGDRAVHVFASDGTRQAEIALDGQPRCLAIGDSRHVLPGGIYVGIKNEQTAAGKTVAKDRVAAFDADGKLHASWPSPGQAAWLTSIALSEDNVFLANYAGRVVYRCDASGKLLEEIGRRDLRRNIPGITAPSPYFDVALAPDGLLRVVNPGARRVEGYTFDGDLEVFWGKSSFEIEGFCGCCNPSHIAILPDGRVATSEKGIFRIKVYSPAGEFESVVAGPETLAPKALAAEETRSDHKLQPFDLAADSRGRILVLDRAAAAVRIFEKKQP